jgi:hypothetical protein
MTLNIILTLPKTKKKEKKYVNQSVIDDLK